MRLFRLTFLLLMLPLAAIATPLPLAGEETLLPDGHLELLFDDNGVLTADAAMAATDWRPLPGDLQLGFTRKTVWVRVTLVRHADAPSAWALKLSNALIDDARLYRQRHLQPLTPYGRQPPWQDDGGSWLELRAGENFARSEWPLDYRSPVFPLQLIEERPTTLLLRLQTKNAMSVDLQFMPRDAFGDFSRREAFVYGIYAGVCLLLVLFHTVFWRMTHAPDSGWYLSYLTTILMTMLLTAGVLQQLLRLPVTLSDPLLGLNLALGTLPIGVIFTSRQLQLARLFPRLQRWLVRGSIALFVVVMAAILSGHYGIGSPLAQLASLTLIPLYLGLALHLWWRGHLPARFFLFAFGIFYAGVIISFLRNFGLLPANTFTDNATTVGTLLHMSIMSLRIIGHYNQLKRDNAAAQREAWAATRALNDRLEQQVAERTAELRAALANETRIREEQREFAAMASHEFRTPLAIIETSAQQIARNPDDADKTTRRCRNIRDAAARMRALVDDYLTADRMEEAVTLQRSHCQLDTLLQEVVAEWPPARVQLTPPPSLLLHVDRGLLLIALRNLVANGDRHAATDSSVDLCADCDGNWLRIRVSNRSSSAIPADERGRLFQKYYRGRQAQQSPGAGLGLYLVRRIAELHGGTVVLISAGDNGIAVFELSLPTAIVSATPTPPESPGTADTLQ